MSDDIGCHFCKNCGHDKAEHGETTESCNYWGWDWKAAHFICACTHYVKEPSVTLPPIQAGEGYTEPVTDDLINKSGLV